MVSFILVEFSETPKLNTIFFFSLSNLWKNSNLIFTTGSKLPFDPGKWPLNGMWTKKHKKGGKKNNQITQAEERRTSDYLTVQ